MNFLVPFFLALLAGQSRAKDDEVKDNPDIKIYFYPEPEEYHRIYVNDPDSIHSSFKKGVKTVVLSGGFFSNQTSAESTAMKDMYHKHKSEYNILLVDWGALNGGYLRDGREARLLPQFVPLYTNAVKSVVLAAEQIANVIVMLHEEKDVEYEDFHVVGHSLGGHIAGNTGHKVFKKSGKKIGRVTGLDPAGPMYDVNLDDDLQLSPDDAHFVDAYHTDRGTYGQTNSDSGHVNIFLNAGDNQPGCEIQDIAPVPHLCSHLFAVAFWLDTLKTTHYGCKCDVKQTCTCRLSLCRTGCKKIKVGYGMSKETVGTYYVETDKIKLQTDKKP